VQEYSKHEMLDELDMGAEEQDYHHAMQEQHMREGA
jgi:hypothetical protein